MSIKSWKPIEYWNDSLALKLHRAERESLASFCKAVSRDRRFKKATGFAEVWERGKQVQLISYELVSAVTTAVRKTPDNLSDFLWAARRVEQIDFYHFRDEDDVDVEEWSLVETEFSMLQELDLNEKQKDYASDLHYELARELGYGLHRDGGGEIICDPGFLVTIAKIARKRIAPGRSPLPKAKQCRRK